MANGSQPVALDVLVIDDDKSIRRTVRVCLESLGCHVVEAAGAAGARVALEQRSYDLALLDLRLGKDNGLELLPALLARGSAMDVVVVTAFATIDTAVEAMRRGAHDYLAKPFTPTQLQQLVERVAARRAVERKIRDLRARRQEAWPEIDLQTESPRMKQALELATRVAADHRPVLLRGEPGSGKALLARRLHALSPRGPGPLVIVGCRAGQNEQLEVALSNGSESPLRAAEGGTLFFDELGVLSSALQERLWRLLDDGPNVRFVAATELDLPRAAQAGRFRSDLLGLFVELVVPPLRERREDILPLARRALAFFARDSAVPQLELTQEAETALLAYDWPGNIRELCQTMERASVLRAGTRVGPDALPERIASRGATTPYLGGEYTVEAIEREHILRVLAQAPSQEEASRILGIDTSTLWRKRKRYET